MLDSFAAPLYAVVIGASGGIGGALVEALVQHNASIMALSRSGTVFDHPAITNARIDITDESSIAQAAALTAQHGEPDIIMCATGVLQDAHTSPEKALKDLHNDALLHAFTVNTIGPALVAKHFIPLLPRDRKSCFAALSARVGSIEDNNLGGWYGYRASKAALNMMLKNIAIETARRHKQAVILGLHPGTVDTGLSKPFSGHVSHEIFSPAQAATYLLNVINIRDAHDSGRLFDWNNNPIAF